MLQGISPSVLTGCWLAAGVRWEVNDDVNNLAYFFMPNHSYYRQHEDLDLEALGAKVSSYFGGFWSG